MRTSLSKNKQWTFVVVAVLLMVFVEFVVLRGDRPYYDDEVADNAVPVIAVTDEDSTEAVEAPRPDMGESYGLNVGDDTALLPPEDEAPVEIVDDESLTMLAEVTPPADPLWRKNAVPAPAVPEGFARVVIIIDDLGVDRKHSQEIIALPGPLTAAFLPYAAGVDAMADTARENGHELIIHMPMEPGDSNLDLGSIALRTGMSTGDFEAMLDRGLSAFDGYVGLNNHMGSKLTQDQDAMNMVMARLYEEGMLFVDSRTIATSVAGETAAAYNIPYAVRDVFIDHDPSAEGVKASLGEVERVARENGLAIAIGHPKAETVAALREWLPTLAGKNMVLVPISAVVTEPALSVAEVDNGAAENVEAMEEEIATLSYIVIPTFAEWHAAQNAE